MAGTETLADIVQSKVDAADKRPRTLPNEWVGIVIHHTGLPSKAPADATAWQSFYRNMTDWLTRRDEAYLSAHYVIGHGGEITCLVDPTGWESFHAGKSAFWHPLRRAWVEDWNRHAIGIELIGDGNIAPYSDQQYDALARLCRALMRTFPTIQPHAIVGHEMIAPGRKSDPGKLFDWKRFLGLLFKA